MSKSYYYYVVMNAIVPSLTRLPVSEIMPVLRAVGSGYVAMDEFRWGDAVATLARGEGTRWESPDLVADWQHLLKQPKEPLRDLLLSLVLHRQLARDLGNAIRTDLSVAGQHFEMNPDLARDAFSQDPALALQHLAHGHPRLVETWVANLVSYGPAPDWSAWGTAVLALDPGPSRDRAVIRYTRMRLKHDEFPARKWAATVPDLATRALAEQQVMVSEIVHQAAENWQKAYEMAAALTETEARQLALEGVFQRALAFDRETVEARADEAAQDAKERLRLMDAWTMGRVADLAEENGKAAQQWRLVLSLRDPELRALQAHRYAHSGRFGGFNEIRQLIATSGLPEPERAALRLELAVDAVDALLDGIHVANEDGGVRAALEATLLIEQPEVRWVQQRAVVHYAMEQDPAEARHRVKSSSLDATTQSRLLAECERLARWHRR